MSIFYRTKARTIKTTLKRAIDVLENNGWTKGTAARSADDLPVTYMSEDAVKFCAYGAILSSNPADELDIHSFLNSYIVDNSKLTAMEKDSDSFSPLFRFNDTRESKKQVLDLFHEALNSLKK